MRGVVCTCTGPVPGYPQHESYCGKTEDEETDVTKPFWCDARCQSWTHPDPEAAEEGRAVCSRCGDEFHCQECGFEIDLNGNCQRTTAGAGQCPPVQDAGAVLAGIVAAAQQRVAQKGRRRG